MPIHQNCWCLVTSMKHVLHLHKILCLDSKVLRMWCTGHDRLMHQIMEVWVLGDADTRCKHRGEQGVLLNMPCHEQCSGVHRSYVAEFVHIQYYRTTSTSRTFSTFQDSSDARLCDAVSWYCRTDSCGSDCRRASKIQVQIKTIAQQRGLIARSV